MVQDIFPCLSGLVLFICAFAYLSGIIVVDLGRRKTNSLQVNHPSDEVHRDTEEPSLRLPFSTTPLNQPQAHDTPNDVSKADRVQDTEAGQCSAQCSKRQHGRPNTDGRWITWNFNSFQFHAYSAFFDNRSSLELDTSQNIGVVRIIALSTRLLDKETYEGNTTPVLINN